MNRIIVLRVFDCYSIDILSKLPSEVIALSRINFRALMAANLVGLLFTSSLSFTLSDLVGSSVSFRWHNSLS